MARESDSHPHPAIRRAHKLIETIAAEVGADLLTCNSCGGDLVVRSTQVNDEPLRNDIRLKCPSDGVGGEPGCGNWFSHGIGKPYIDRETYEKEMSMRRSVAAETGHDGPVRHVDAVNTPAPESAVEERLQALGYVEM